MADRKRLVFFSNLFPDAQRPYRGLDNATVLHQLTPDFEIRAIAARPNLPFLRWNAPSPRAIDKVFSTSFLRVPYVPKIGSRINHRLMASTLRQALGELRKSFEFDLLLASWLYPDGCAATRVASELGVPSVLIAQGTDVHGYLKISARRPLILKAVEEASATVTRSISLAELLSEAGADRDKIFPIHNGADTAVFHPAADRGTAKAEMGVAPEAPLLLFVGNLLPVKNPLMLIDAWAMASARMPADPPHLVMAGQGPLREAVVERASHHDLSDRLTLTGGIDSTEVARWMRAADLLCLTSHNEGLPNVVIESLACGLRVLATDVGGIGELIDRNSRGALTPPGNVGDYASALEKLLAEQALSPDDHQDTEAYSWSRCAEEYRSVLKGVLGQ